MKPSIEFRDANPIETQVQDINYIPGYKIKEEERRKNEEIRINNENERKINEEERESFYEELLKQAEEGKINNVYVGKEEPTEKTIKVWIDPNGNPEVAAENIVFSDNKTLQEKYENGDLKGDKGDKGEDGSVSFEDLTEEQKNSLKGEQGIQGEDGKSAYQIWLDEGNTGTETDFLNSLKGEQGIQGEKGEQGEAGIIESQEYSGGDLNNLTTTGFYFIKSSSNKPDTNNGYLLVHAFNSANLYQHYTDYINGNSYERIRCNGTWETWKKIIKE